MNILTQIVPADFHKIVILILASTVFTYVAPTIVSDIWFGVTLILYYRSKDEPLWLVFYLLVTDGFMGFFGVYEATLSILPGLPPIEVAQFYIILTLVKALSRKRKRVFVYYYNYALIIGIYIIVLIIYSYIIGRSGGVNIHFRLFKEVFPFLLFFSLPQLMNSEKHYRRFFALLFPFAISAFVSQLVNIGTGQTPAQFLGFSSTGRGGLSEFNIDKSTYRGFYSPQTVIISFFGTLFYLASNRGKNRFFMNSYLWIIAISIYASCFLSATRGWIIGFGIPLFLFFIFFGRINIRQILSFFIVIGLFFIIVNSIPSIQLQINNATDRMLTLQALAEGDVTAGGTLERLDTRAPPVIENWLKSPVFGWGYSDYLYYDNHVAHLSILARSGLVGYILLHLFFAFYFIKLWLHSRTIGASKNILYKALNLFFIFFLGWFFIHSSSGRHFGYVLLPLNAIPQATFFAFGATLYRQSKISINKEKSIHKSLINIER